MLFRLRRRTAVVVVSAVALAGAGLVPAAGAALSTPVPFPAKPKGLTAPVAQPAEVDEPAGYQPQVSCNPVEQRGVRRLRALVIKTYGQGTGGIVRSCVYGSDSEHKEGRALDWMLNVNNRAQRTAAAHFLAWLTRNDGRQARRLGVMYVIFNRKMWRTYDTDRGWTAYTGSSPHTDHIHLSFTWAGARGRTSFWTGRVSGPDYGPCVIFRGQMARLTSRANRQPCAEPARLVKHTRAPILQHGASGRPAIRQAQRRLGVSVTGRFDGATWAAVKRYQRAHDLPVTGVVDKPTWTSLSPRSVTWSATAGYGPLRAARYANTNYSRVALRRGSAGVPVAFLQAALKMPVADRNGWLGPRTAAAVREFKVRNGYPRTAWVTPGVWQALAAHG